MFRLISIFIYRLAVNVYHLAIALASFFNEKAYKFTTGRLNQNVAESKEKTIWFHCASLGEFEQAKPIISWCYNNLHYPIIISFFSPSGYSYKKTFPLAKAVYYLPKDTPQNAKEFIKSINPILVFFIKYEFWYFHLSELKKQNIAHYLVAGIFRSDQLFFKSYGILHQEMLHNYSHVFVQDEESKSLLDNHNFLNNSLAFDTRFDTVKQISDLNFTNDIIEEFIGKTKCLVVGSSWHKDDVIIAASLSALKDYKIIVAPHDINAPRLKQVKATYKSTTLLSNPVDLKSSKVLIIDSIGKLSLLYRYANICYIGGGFGVSVHNVLEAAVYGKALIFGPNHKKSKEAMDLKELGAAKEINNTHDFIQIMEELQDSEVLKEASDLAKNYVLERRGGTQEIIKELGLGRKK